MWWSALLHRFRRRSDDDFAAEVEAHLEMEVERLVSSGMSESEARFAARRTFGNPTSARERFHDNRPGASLEWVARDARYALRGMRRNPAFTVIVIASLAIGIGANSTIFGVVDALLFRTPAAVRDANRIQRVYLEMPNDRGGAEPQAYLGYGAYAAIRDRAPGFESVAAFWQLQVSSGHGAEARSIQTMGVTPSFFHLLGLKPALGRFFVPNEERDDGNHVAVLGYDAWRSWYGGDSAVLGRSIPVDGLPYTIIGITPKGFNGINLDRVDLWVPLGLATRTFTPEALDPHSTSYWLEVMGRRRSDVSVAEVEREVTRVFHDVFRDQPRYEETFGKSRAALGPILASRGPARGPSARISIWLAAVSLIVLLIACANVATLMLIRGLSRARETALRLSLGAARSQLVRQALVEGMLLAAISAACALIVARWSEAALRTYLLSDAAEVPLSHQLTAFTALVAIVAGLIASLAPALIAVRRDFGALVNGARSSATRERLRLQRVLISAQVALAMLLVIGAGLFVESLRNVSAIDLGFDLHHVLYVHADAETRAQRDDRGAQAANAARYRAMLESARRVPGVTRASVTSGAPFATTWGVSVRRRGAPEPAPGTRMPFARGVGPDYFETMGTRLLRGRFFSPADRSSAAHVAIIDEAVAHEYWPDEEPLDPCVYIGSESYCTRIVGVVANTARWQVTGDKGYVVYFPLEAFPEEPISMMEVQTAGDPASLIPAVRRAVTVAVPNLPWVNIFPMSRPYDDQLKPWRVGASMFSVFGALALLLAAVGLYALLSYAVAQRTHEIGVRKALGAADMGLIRMVLGDALSTTLVGVAVGVVLALGAVRLIAHLLYGVSPRDPFVFALGALVLALVAVVACLAPALRAARVDPMVALRAE